MALIFSILNSPNLWKDKLRISKKFEAEEKISSKALWDLVCVINKGCLILFCFKKSFKHKDRNKLNSPIPVDKKQIKSVSAGTLDLYFL